MAIFYVLPPRPVLGEALARLLREFFPGLDWDLPGRADLVETLTDPLRRREGIYVVFRDDLPAEEALTRALVDGFGAERGDEVVEVHVLGLGGLTNRRWVIQGSLAA